jgi:1-acyl-sn-glycerol-3-phosphate acyltransferase
MYKRGITNMDASKVENIIAAKDISFSTIVYFTIRFFARIIMRLFFSLEYDGLHYLREQKGPVILAGNHTGWLDTLALSSACNRRVRFLTAEWVTKWPILGPLIVALGGIPVCPGKGLRSIEDAVACLAHGDDICIFPEGVLSTDGNLAQFRSGVAKLHKESGCPIIPFAIYGGYEAWPYNHLLPHFHKIAIHFGIPFSMSASHLGEITRELEDTVGFMKASLYRRYSSDEEKTESLLSLLQAKSDVFSARPAVSIKNSSGWYELSYAELSRQAIKLSSYLIEAGINYGDNIAILSESRPEFAVCFFGSMRAGATIVPLDIKLTSTELQNLLLDCCPKVIFISSNLVKAFEEVKDSLNSDALCFIIDHDKECEPYKSMHNLIPSEKLSSRNRSAEDVALIIYTSGTTGKPKGVMNTIGNLVFEASQFDKLANPQEGDRFLSILPLFRCLARRRHYLLQSQPSS